MLGEATPTKAKAQRSRRHILRPCASLLVVLAVNLVVWGLCSRLSQYQTHSAAAFSSTARLFAESRRAIAVTPVVHHVGAHLAAGVYALAVYAGHSAPVAHTALSIVTAVALPAAPAAHRLSSRGPPAGFLA